MIDRISKLHNALKMEKLSGRKKCDVWQKNKGS